MKQNPAENNEKKAKLSRKKKKGLKKQEVRHQIFKKTVEPISSSETATVLNSSECPFHDDLSRETLKPIPSSSELREDNQRVIYQPQSRFSLVLLKYFLAFIVFLAVTMVCYINTIDNRFYFDSLNNILNNETIRITSLTWKNILDVGSKSRGVAFVTFAINYFFHGYEVEGYHLINIIVHAINGVLLFLFISLTLQIQSQKEEIKNKTIIALTTAALWLVHPIQTQSVVYIVQRMNSLAALFFMVSLIFYIKGRLCEKFKGRISFFCLSTCAGLAAVGSKENAFILPFVIGLYEWFFFQDLRVPSWKKFWSYILCILLIGFFIVVYKLGPDFLSRSYDRANYFTMEQRLLTEPRIIFFYLSLIFLPIASRFSLSHSVELSNSLLQPITTVLSITGIFLVVVGAIYFAKKYRLLSFCVLWFFINHIIESSIIPLEIIFEHRNYLPSMLLSLAVVYIIFSLFQNRINIVGSFVLVVLICLSISTFQRNKVWDSRVSLWSDAFKKAPDYVHAAMHLGNAYQEEGRYDEAIAVYKKIFWMKRQQFETLAFLYQNIGLAYLNKGMRNEAKQYLTKAVQLNPHNTEIKGTLDRLK